MTPISEWAIKKAREALRQTEPKWYRPDLEKLHRELQRPVSIGAWTATCVCECPDCENVRRVHAVAQVLEEERANHPDARRLDKLERAGSLEVVRMVEGDEVGYAVGGQIAMGLAFDSLRESLDALEGE